MSSNHCHVEPADPPGPGPLVFGLLWGVGQLPLPLLHGAGVVLGWLTALVPNRHRSIARRNIEACFPELDARARRRLVRRSLVETAKTALETLAIWLAPADRLPRWTREVRGGERLAQAIGEGRGVIFAAPHLGSWEYLGSFLVRHIPLTNMFRPPRQRSMTGLVRAGRTRNGSKLVPTDAGGIRALLQALRRGEAVGVLPDQDPRGNGVFAPFFGVPASTMTLLSRLASKSRATVLFCFAERLPRGRGFRIHFLPAPEGIESDDAAEAAAAINAGVEACVRLAPSQYQWNYKRFRTRPPGESRFYPRHR